MSRFIQWMRSSLDRNSHEHGKYEALPLASTPPTDMDHDDAQRNGGGGFFTSAASSPSRFRRPVWLDSNKRPNRYWLGWILPFIIARPLGLTERRLPKVGSTSYLNGIRGLACWIVVNYHLTVHDYPDYQHPYGCSWKGCGLKRYHFFQLPFIRTLVSGDGMVSLFFVLSGFVLAFSNLRRINADADAAAQNDDNRDGNNNNDDDDKNGNALLTSLSSSALRRGLRLFLPLFMLIFLTALMLQLVPNVIHDHRPFLVQLHRLWRQVSRMCLNPYDFESTDNPSYMKHAWTLGVEYRMSLVVYFVILLTCKISTGWRKLAILFTAWWGMYTDRRWEVVCFMGGMMIAELRFAPLSRDFGSLFRRWTRRSLNVSPSMRLIRILAIIAVVVGILFLGWPARSHHSQPYATLQYLAPKNWRRNHDVDRAASVKRYFGSIGAILVIWGLEQLEFMKWLLSRTPFLYAGEISYSFYLLQKLVHAFFNEPFREYLRHSRHWKFNAAFFADYVLGIIILTVLSDYYWRFVDEPSAKIAQWFSRDLLGVGAKKPKKPDVDKESKEETLDAYPESLPQHLPR